MTALAVDHYLRYAAVIGSLDTLLQPEHHRAGGVDDLNAVAAGGIVGRWRLAVGTQQHLDVVQGGQVVVRYGAQTAAAQALDLAAVVHYIAQAIQAAVGVELVLGFLYGRDYAEAETRLVIYLNLGKHCQEI